MVDIVVQLLTHMINSDYYLLTIDANGVSNTRRLQDLANEVGAAFHHSSYLESISNGTAVYKINFATSSGGKVDEDDF